MKIRQIIKIPLAATAFLALALATTIGTATPANAAVVAGSMAMPQAGDPGYEKIRYVLARPDGVEVSLLSDGMASAALGGAGQMANDVNWLYQHIPQRKYSNLDNFRSQVTDELFQHGLAHWAGYIWQWWPQPMEHGEPANIVL